MPLRPFSPSSTDAQAVARFAREARALARLSHPNVLAVYDYGQDGATHFLVMELGGTDLGQLIEFAAGPLPLEQTVQVVKGMINALEYAHAHGVVHRDLKPANILFRADGRPVIVDFGLARDMRINSTLIVAGQFLATPRYMSPEQCLGNSVDARSDLYSLGAMLYEMMTGNKIYDHAHSADVIAMHVHAPVPQLTGMLSVHQPLLDRLLAKNPEDRFQSAAEVIAEIGL